MDSIGLATFITKLDLLKGHWQIPLTPRWSQISAFLTPNHFPQYTVIALGMQNEPATFQRLMNTVVGDIPNCNMYIDDVVVYSSCWPKHIAALPTDLENLKRHLSLNLV